LGPSAAIYVTAKEPDKDIDSSTKLVIVAVARAQHGNDAQQLRGRNHRARAGSHQNGTGSGADHHRPAVHLLDHDGRRTDRTLSIQNGAFEIEGAVDKTPYYLVEF